MNTKDVDDAIEYGAGAFVVFMILILISKLFLPMIVTYQPGNRYVPPEEACELRNEGRHTYYVDGVCLVEVYGGMYIREDKLRY